MFSLRALWVGHDSDANKKNVARRVHHPSFDTRTLGSIENDVRWLPAPFAFMAVVVGETESYMLRKPFLDRDLITMATSASQRQALSAGTDGVSRANWGKVIYQSLAMWNSRAPQRASWSGFGIAALIHKMSSRLVQREQSYTALPDDSSESLPAYRLEMTISLHSIFQESISNSGHVIGNSGGRRVVGCQTLWGRMSMCTAAKLDMVGMVLLRLGWRLLMKLRIHAPQMSGATSQ